MDAFVSYEGLPINSGGAHSLGRQPAEKIFSDTVSFLKRFTTHKNPIQVDLTFYNSQDGRYKTMANVWKLVKKFGLPKSGSWKFPGKTQYFWTWSLQTRQINKALEELKKISTLPGNEYGPLILSILWHFKFIDEGTKEVLKDQELIPELDIRRHNSQVYLRLGQKPTVSVWFTFPFPEFNKENKKYLDSLVKSLPFKPSDKHWRIWKKSKNGNWLPKTIELNNA